MQLSEEYWWDSREMVYAGFGWRHAQRHEDHISQLLEQCQAQDSSLAGGREADLACLELLEGEL